MATARKNDSPAVSVTDAYTDSIKTSAVQMADYWSVHPPDYHKPSVPPGHIRW